jgi:hypothetical protein
MTWHIFSDESWHQLLEKDHKANWDMISTPDHLVIYIGLTVTTWIVLLHQPKKGVHDRGSRRDNG